MMETVSESTQSSSLFRVLRLNDLKANFLNGFQSTIGRRFVLLTLCFSSAIALLMTVVQLSVDYRTDLKEIESGILSVEKSALPGLAESVWQLDFDLIQSYLNGIAQVSGVVLVEVHTGDVDPLRSGDIESRVDHEYRFDLSANVDGQKAVLGELRIGVSYDQIWFRLIRRAALILFTNFLRTLAVAVFILMLHNHLVGRRLARMVDYINIYDPEKKPRRLDMEGCFSTKSDEDELTLLSRTIDDWAGKNHSYVSRLRDANKEITEFNYALSHDLKSPTNTICMLLNYLHETGGPDWDEETDETWNALDLTANRMAQLIYDIEVYSSTIGEELNLEAVDLNDEMHSVLEDLSDEIRASNTRVELCDLPVLTCDAIQIRLLIKNLLSNAVKFYDPQRDPKVVVESKISDDGWLVLQVQDNGIGMSESHLTRIFDLFKRLHTYADYRGSGVGLSICQKVVSNHGGSISVSSLKDHGTVFTVKIPGVIF